MLAQEQATSPQPATQAWPVIVTTEYRTERRPLVRDIRVLMLQPGQLAPDDFVPTDATIVKRDELPATRLDDMPLGRRSLYLSQFRAYAIWRVAKQRDRHPLALRAWEDYDPVQIDEDVQRWVQGSLRWAE